MILAWLLPSVWAPTITALILIRSEGAGAVSEELRARLKLPRGAGRWMLAAGIMPPAVMAAAIFIARAAGEGAPFAPIGSIPVMIALQLVTGAVGEEVGWRGFLLPRLGKMHGRITAAWTMGILWSLWHLPAFFFPGMPHSMMPMIPNLMLAAFFGVFMAFVFNRAGESVLVTMLAHLSLNIASGFGGVQITSTVYWWTLAGIFGAVALLVSSKGVLRARPSSTGHAEALT